MARDDNSYFRIKSRLIYSSRVDAFTVAQWPYNICFPGIANFTVLSANSDSDVMFCLQLLSKIFT